MLLNIVAMLYLLCIFGIVYPWMLTITPTKDLGEEKITCVAERDSTDCSSSIETFIDEERNVFQVTLSKGFSPSKQKFQIEMETDILTANGVHFEAKPSFQKFKKSDFTVSFLHS